MLDEKKERAAKREEERRGWRFHWQNLKEDSPKKWLHGRCWLNRRPNYDHEISAEWVMPGIFDFGITVGGNYQIQLCIGLLLFTFYISLDRFKLLQRRGWQGMETSFAIYDWSFHWKVWTPEHEWSAKTPKWRDGWFSIPDFFLGKAKYSKVEQEPIPITISMPEGDYGATVTLETRTWKRPRWPLARVVAGWDIDIKGGIPIPGKGENSWDCDDDALYSMSTAVPTIEEAIVRVIESVSQRRKKYGGLNWQPEPKKERK